MSRFKSSLRTAVPVVLAMLVGAAMVGVAQSHPGDKALLHSGHSDTMKGTLKARNFKYLQPKTFKYTVPAGAIMGEDAAEGVNHAGYSGEAVLVNGASAVAGVMLPTGSRVTKVQLFSESTDFIRIHLEKNPLATGGDHVDMSEFNSTACGNDFCVATDTTIDQPKIVGNRHYGLWIDNQDTPNVSVFKVVITYKTNSPLPPIGTGVAAAGGPGSDTNP